MNSKSLLSLKSLWKNLSNKHKILCAFVCILSILAALLESLVIITFIPFITNISGDLSFTSNQFTGVFEKLDFLNLENKTITFFIFIVFILLSSGIRLLYIFLTAKTSAKIGSYLSKKIYGKLLNQSYLDHVMQDSSYVIQMVTSNIARTVTIISSCSLVISGILVTFAILYTLIITEPFITTITIVLLLLSYSVIYISSKGGLYEHGKIVKINEQKIIKLVKESLDSIREIIINNMYSKYMSEYNPLDQDLRQIQAKARFIAQYPRYLIECLMILIITTIAFLIGRDSSEVLPKLAVFSLGFLRILPAIQQIYSNLANIKTYTPSLDAINNCLNKTQIYGNIINDFRNSKKKLIKQENVPNDSSIIQLSNVTFKYPLSNEIVLKEINFKIFSGLNYAITGVSGSGKSTLQDILLGLLPPDSGAVFFKSLNISEIKNRIYFHSHVAHVSQMPLIFNTSIKNNIIYGSSNVDKNKLMKCIADTALEDLIESETLDFNCGENGINLSGGQKQRLAIARALYSNKEILFLDECTSALDAETEKYILNNIFTSYKDKTVISITHKKNTLHLYNKIIQVSEGNLTELNQL